MHASERFTKINSLREAKEFRPSCDVERIRENPICLPIDVDLIIDNDPLIPAQTVALLGSARWFFDIHKLVVVFAVVVGVVIVADADAKIFVVLLFSRSAAIQWPGQLEFGFRSGSRMRVSKLIRTKSPLPRKFHQKPPREMLRKLL